MPDQSRESSQDQLIVAVLSAFFRHRRLFTSVAVVVFLLVAAVTLATKRLYESDMKFLLENNRSNAVIAADRTATPALLEITEAQINSELEVLASEDILSAVADPGWSSLAIAERSPALLKQHQLRLDNFRKRLHVQLAHKSNVIDVSLTAPSSLEATQKLENFSAAYLAHRKRLSRPVGTSKFFADEASRYKEAWQQANATLVEFQQEHQLVSVEQSEQTLNKQIASEEDDLRSNNASLAETGMQLAAGTQAEITVPERQATQQHTVVGQNSVDQLRTLLVQLQNRKTELLTRYTAGDRLVAEVDHQIIDTSTALIAAQTQKGQEDTTDVNPAWQGVKSLVVEGTINRQAQMGRGNALKRSIAQLRSHLGQLQALDVRFNALQEQVDQARSNFEVFSEKRDQAQIEDAMDEQKLVNVAVAQSPTSSYRPTSPKLLLNAVLGLFTALFLAAGAVYFVELSRATFATPKELEAASRFPVLATVPGSVRQETANDPASSFDTISTRGRGRRFSPRMIPAMQNFVRTKKT